jgi:hypothetical protein
LKKLSNSINALFHKSLDEAEIASMVKGLKKRGVISLNGESVTYRL